MRILWHSNAPHARTGYGVQTALTVPKLREQGHDIAVSAFYGLHGGTLEVDGIRIYPGLRDGFGNDVLHAHAQHFAGGRLEDVLIILLLDVWVMRHEICRAPARVAAWVPVDHDPAPPGVREFFEQTDTIPIAMSRFGERMLKAFDPIYVPHAIDRSVMYPRERNLARAELKIPNDKFVVGMVAANKGNAPSRKSFSESIEAFAKFHKNHPDALLYMHTEATGSDSGVPLAHLLAHHNIPTEAVVFPDQYQLQITGFSDDYMAHAFSAMDVLLNPAMGEGFGVPILESQSCGTPVIVTDGSAMTEVGEVGWHVNGQHIWTYQNSYQIIPNIEQIVQALDASYTQASRMRDGAAKHAEQYDIERVIPEHWVPALAEIEKRLEDRRPNVQVLERAA